MKWTLITITAAAALLAGLLLLGRGGPKELKVSGVIEAHEIRLGSRVGGRVKSVMIEEGQVVAADQTLIELEPFDLEQKRAEAEAELSARRAEYEKLASGYRAEEVARIQAERDRLAARLQELINGPRPQEIAAAEARLDLARASLSLAESDHQKTSEVYERGAGTEREMDRAADNLKAAQAAVSLREHELSLLQEGTRPEEIAQARAQLDAAEQDLKQHQDGYRPEEVAAAKAAMHEAEAGVALVERQIAELVIRSPVDGVIEAIDLRPGDLVPAGAPAISVMDRSALWVRAYVPQEHLSIQTGQKTEVTVDALPGKRFTAHVSFVARQAEFIPGNVQTPEERSKQVFRVKVAMDKGMDLLRPGMAADVWFTPEPGP